MRFSKAIAAGLLCATMGATAATAESLKEYGSVGNWGIWVNPIFGNGCLMRGVFSGGTEVRVGLDARSNEGYLALFNDAWDITPGQVDAVTVDLDGTKYETTGLEVVDHGRQGGAGFSTNRQFFEDIANKQTMTVFRNGEAMTAIDLTGTKAAMQEALACQAAQG